MAVIERNCTVLFNTDEALKNTRPEDLRKNLESKDVEVKAEALKHVIFMTLSGMPLQGLLMHVIKYCLRERDHTIKKLMHTFWEIVDKKGDDGKLLPQMILVCNHLQNDLIHSNEYIRGSTLRLLCKIQETEILEQVISQVLGNLEHRHSFVRKNAVLCVWRIVQNNAQLIPDAAERLERILENEGNENVQRNAILALYQIDLKRGLTYLHSQLEHLPGWPENMQLVALEIIRKACRSLRIPKGLYLQAAYGLLNSSSNTVVYEAANTLLSMTNLQSAVKSSVTALTKILQTESDQNVKLIILNRLSGLKNRYVLGNHVMDILRALSTPNNDVREKVLSLVIDLTSTQNIDEVITNLKRELTNIEGQNDVTNAEELSYKNLLVETIHQCAVKFPNVGQSVVEVLLDFLSDEGSTAKDVILFVREFVEKHENLRPQVMTKLIQNVPDIVEHDVYRTALWIISEYSLNQEEVESALQMLFEQIGELPLAKDMKKEREEEPEETASETDQTPQYTTRTVVLDDGTYAQETVQLNTSTVTKEEEHLSNLRKHILNGKYFFCVALAQCLTKLCLRYQTFKISAKKTNSLLARCLLVITSVLRVGEMHTTPIDDDSKENLMLSVRVLLKPTELHREVFLNSCKKQFSTMLEVKSRKEDKGEEKEELKILSDVDSLLNFRQLKGTSVFIDDDEFESTLSKAVGNVAKGSGLKDRLERVSQLTGFSDPIYAEACVSVHQFDIVLDILVINQTKNTLQNVNLELQTSGDLKLIEKPETIILASRQTKRLQASIKVSSTESGVIFGNIVYDTTGASSDRNIVVMNSIHMDVRDYIQPASIEGSKFSDMWAEFEWENKVPISTDFTSAEEYLKHIVSVTNMKCITPLSNMSATAGGQFLAANLYAKSIFGEDALINLSVEVLQGSLSGYIRIRSKTQGIALSLGEKINTDQRRKNIKVSPTKV